MMFKLTFWCVFIAVEVLKDFFQTHERLPNPRRKKNAASAFNETILSDANLKEKEWFEIKFNFIK